MGFAPIRTERLILRPSVLSDAQAAHERRNLAEVARYQDWELPYTLERAERVMAELVEMDGPADGVGWSLTVVDASAPKRILGDLYVGLKWGGRSAEVGYTFHPDHWGVGYATEATEAMIDHLFTVIGVQRVEASLHPDNVASARVLEACGLTYEGLRRRSFWVGDVCSDDLLYGMPRPDWDAWTTRPRSRPERVEFVELSVDNVRAVEKLATHKSQERFVAPMSNNFADALALATSSTPWYRAIAGDGDVVGFIMAQEPDNAHANPHLMRLLVDRLHQRRGIGAAALDLFEQRCRQRGAAAIEVSWAEGPGSPAQLYLARGFVPSGRIDDGEIHAVKELD